MTGVPTCALPIFFVGSRLREPYFLEPAVRSRDGVGLHRVRQVLVDAAVAPPHPAGIGVVRFPWLDAGECAHAPASRLRIRDVDFGRHIAVAGVLLPPPPPDVVRAADDAGLDGLGDPHLVDKVADFSFDFQQVPVGDAQVAGVLWVEPDWVAVRNLG